MRLRLSDLEPDLASFGMLHVGCMQTIGQFTPQRGRSRLGSQTLADISLLLSFTPNARMQKIDL